MDITIDTSALIAVIANEPQKNEIVRLTEGVKLCAPASVHWEIDNAFSAMLKRNRISFNAMFCKIGSKSGQALAG